MKRALFFSDLHIYGNQDPKLGLVVDFLNKQNLTNQDQLFLVGDIFDLWIAGQPYFINSYARFIECIRSLLDRGVTVHYFEGNHDLDLKVFWGDQLGVKTYAAPHVFKLGTKVIRVEHGDQMNLNDKGYLFLRWFLRTPVMRFLGRHLPDRLVKYIGERASSASRQYTSEVKKVNREQTLTLIRNHALKWQEAGLDLLICGHVHESMDEQVGQVRAINLGTWLKSPTVLLIEYSDSEFFVRFQNPS